MNTKHSPRKVTLAMIKGKPITTSVPIIHFHASDDELEEIYPSTDEEKRLTPEFERISSKLTSSPQRCTEKRSTQESDVSESNSECRSISAENVIVEGTPPSLDPWKMLSDIKGKITKTFEEKLSEMKNDKKRSCHSRAESSSISDLEDQGSVTPCDDRTGNDKQTNEPSTTVILRRNNPVRYVGFSGVKTGLKDKSLQDECVESGIEASEFSPDTYKDPAAVCTKSSISLRKSSGGDNLGSIQKQTSYVRSTVLSTQTNLKAISLHLLKQLGRQLTYRSVAALIAVFCIYYVSPLPEYLIGLVTGVVATLIFYDTMTRFKIILTNLPDETFAGRQVVPVLEIPAVEEHAVIERFQGWLNELPYRYEPTNYHVARTKSVFLRLEGSILRIMETRMKVPKKAVWDEVQQKLKFVKRRVYNLSGAKVELVPCGLARKRRWSKKYPICITLKKKQAHVCNRMLKGAMNDDECYSTNNGQGETMSESIGREGESATGRIGEQKQKDGEDEQNVDDYAVLLEKEENTAELNGDEDDVENFHSDFDNNEFDNEYVGYKRRVLENGTVVDVCKRINKRSEKNGINNRRGREKENDGTANGNWNANTCYSCGCSYSTRRKKKRRMILKQVKRRKRSNPEMVGKNEVEEKRKMLAKEGTECYEELDDGKGELFEDNDRENDDENQDDDDDDDDDEDNDKNDDDDDGDDDNDGDDDDDNDDDDDDEDDDNDDDDDDDDDEDENDDDDDDNNDNDDCDDNDDYDDNGDRGVDEDNDKIEDEENKTLDDKKNTQEMKIGFNSLEGGGEKKERREGSRGKEKEKEKEEEKDAWETIDGARGASRITRSQKNFQKKRRNGRRLRNRIKLFIFARADREKEDWYRRLVSASSTRRVKKRDASSCFATDASSTLNATLSAQRTVTTESKLSASTNNSFENVPELNYNAYMAKHLDGNGSTVENEQSPCTDNTLWINCLVARILFDVHKCPETVNLIKDKVQRKLSSIKLPYFMECLLVSEVAIGQGSPIIRNVTKPMTNERGLWLDFDITYKGSLTMTVETKLNLMKLTRSGTIGGGGGGVGSGADGGNLLDCPEKDKAATKSPIFDSDMEDTPETSTEDEDGSQLCGPAAKETTPSAQSSGRKFLRIVDRIAANKYFQHATELSYVRRAMEGVSNTEIRLMVTLSSIEGCVSLNIPPAPSDRLWYGFKPVPKVTLTVKPAVGERAVNIAYITKWIEDKLLRELEKLVVLPNMDDLVLPLCPNYPYTSAR